MANPTTWLTPQQAAEYAKCDVVTLRRAVQRGLLLAYRVNGGRRVRFRAEDVDQWLSRKVCGSRPRNKSALWVCGRTGRR